MTALGAWLLGVALGFYLGRRRTPLAPLQLPALTAEHALATQVLHSLSQAVLALDATQTILVANPAAQLLLKHTQGLAGRTLLECLRAPNLQQAVLVALKGHQATAEIDRGAEGRLLAVLTPVLGFSTAGETSAVRVVVALTDVTELRRLEVVRRDFVANVSHELRTPVSVVRANAETLLGGALDDPPAARAFAEAILRSAERLHALLVELLDTARLDAGQYQFNLQPVRVSSVVQRVLVALQQRAQQNNVHLHYAVQEHWVLADDSALEQVLVNYVDNAIVHAGVGAAVRVVESQQPEGWIRLCVEDNGPGIEAKHLPRVFERFYRVDQARSRSNGGTGLGLAIAKHLAEGMGGRVGAEALEPHGTRFWLDLGAAKRQGVAE